MMCSCVCRPNCKRLLLAMLAVAVFVFVYEWLLHGMILDAAYRATASLWRSETQMQAHMPWLMAGQLLTAVMFCYIYSFMRTCGGIKGGVCYGLMIGLLMSAPNLVTYAVQPMPFSLIGAWMIGGLVEAALAGAIVAAIYPHDNAGGNAR